MEEKNNRNKKELTLNDLAQIMDERFKESKKHADGRFKSMDERFKELDKSIDSKLEKLATSVQKEFLELKEEIKEVKSNTENIKADLNKKIDRVEYNGLVYRVEKLEEKIA